MATEFIPSRTLFAEMLSLAFEGRCLLDEHRHCEDQTRRRALLVRHVAVQQRWDELFVRHAEATATETRAAWMVGREIYRLRTRGC